MFCSGETVDEQEEVQAVKIKKIQNYFFNYADKIGQGNFSKVYSGVEEKSGQSVAIKVIEVSSINSQTLSNLLHSEIEVLKHLKHPNVILCYDVLTSVNNCYIVTQYCENGDLDRALRKKKRFQEKEINKLVYDIYKGLLYLGNNSIVHRDLKVANVFLTSNNTAKIADFGFAVKSNQTFKDMSIGSPIYMSPEGLLKYQYGPKTDIWSFGVMLFELVNGQPPLSYCRTEEQLKQGVMMPPKYTVDTSKQLRQLIELCMNPSQKMRITIQELIKTPFIQRVVSFVEGVKIPKQMLSTNYTSQKSLRVTSPLCSHLFPNVLSYENGLAIIHYCRLLHKTLKLVSSTILAQWLITLSGELVRANVDSKCEKAEKMVQVTEQYYKKFQHEHLVLRIDRNVEQALIEINTMSKACKDMVYLCVVKKQTEHLHKFLKNNNYSFAKFSTSESFMNNLK